VVFLRQDHPGRCKISKVRILFTIHRSVPAQRDAAMQWIVPTIGHYIFDEVEKGVLDVAVQQGSDILVWKCTGKSTYFLKDKVIHNPLLDISILTIISAAAMS
jgi:hypothetical protein